MSHQEQEQIYPCRLYLISPPRVIISDFKEKLAQALQAGDVGAFQLRLKDADDKTVIATARELIPICHQHQVAFILNDRPDLALEVGADGVHLGQEDGSLAKARELLGPDAVIGVSCHDSSHLAMQAGEEGADYVAFGAFFPTQSKSPEALAKYGTPTIEMLEWWSAYTVLPSVAIGGLTPQNCVPMIEAGADFIAAITAIWQHPKSPAHAVQEFNTAIKQTLKRKPEGAQPTRAA